MLGFTGIVLTEALAGKTVLQVQLAKPVASLHQLFGSFCVIGYCLPHFAYLVLVLCSSTDLQRVLTQPVFPRFAEATMERNGRVECMITCACQCMRYCMSWRVEKMIPTSGRPPQIALVYVVDTDSYIQ